MKSDLNTTLAKTFVAFDARQRKIDYFTNKELIMPVR
jgi:hypothetical protein